MECRSVIVHRELNFQKTVCFWPIRYMLCIHVLKAIACMRCVCVCRARGLRMKWSLWLFMTSDVIVSIIAVSYLMRNNIISVTAPVDCANIGLWRRSITGAAMRATVWQASAWMLTLLLLVLTHWSAWLTVMRRMLHVILRTTMWGKKTVPNYFSNNFVKPRSILITFGSRVL